ncbi:MAG: CcmD family protein [bacterium]
MGYVAAAYVSVGLLLAIYVWTLRARQRELARLLRQVKSP